MSSPALGHLQLRIATEADIDALVRLINTAFLVERFFIEGDRIQAAGIQQLLATGWFLVGHDDDSIHGCVHIEPRGERAYLGLLSVDPERQRTGLGSRLVAAAKERVRASGVRYMDLRVVNLRQELPDFYQKLGYVITGTSPVPRP